MGTSPASPPVQSTRCAGRRLAFDMSDDPVIDEFSADEEVMSRELWDRIIAYDESLATGQALDLRNNETIRGLPKSAREQVHEVLECLEILAQFRSQPLRADPAADRQQVKKNELETRDWPAGPAPSASRARRGADPQSRTVRSAA